jgi:hypothetical protein
MELSEYAKVLWSLAVWREARNQPHPAKLGVAYCIFNRASRPSWWGTDIVSCILKPWQFSSFNHNDPNAVKFPIEADTSWTDSCQAVEDVLASALDPTGGATSYFDKSLDASPPAWATDGSMTLAANIGDFHFYKL